MKKTAFVTILSATLLFTSCSSAQNPGTSAATEVTTTAATTEATTASTTAEETTTIAETSSAEPEKTEDYAQVYFRNEDGTNNATASDFEFVDAELYKDPNGVIYYPNYRSGKTMEIRFKSDKDFKYINIFRCASNRRSSSEDLIKIVRKGNGWKSNTTKYLTYQNGVYSLKIPSKFAKSDSTFNISLYTNFPNHSKEKRIIGNTMSFSIRCDKETAVPTPSFTHDDHVRNYGVNAKDFNFIDAIYTVSNDKYTYTPDPPIFPADHDMVITFKCKDNIKLKHIIKSSTENFESYEDITNSDYVSINDGVYMVTIPAKHAQGGYYFSVYFTLDDNELMLFFRTGT